MNALKVLSTGHMVNFQYYLSLHLIQFSEALERLHTSPALASLFGDHGSTDLTDSLEALFFFNALNSLKRMPIKFHYVSLIYPSTSVFIPLPAYFLERNSCVDVFAFPLSIHYWVHVGVLCLPYESWNTTDILNISHDGNFCIQEP